MNLIGFQKQELNEETRGEEIFIRVSAFQDKYDSLDREFTRQAFSELLNKG